MNQSRQDFQEDGIDEVTLQEFKTVCRPREA